jgi:hypothetical protein
MAVTTLDTHEVVKELLAAGFSDKQAEAVTRVVQRSQDIDLSNLATKADLQIGLAAAKVDLAETKAEILKWMVGSLGVQTVVILDSRSCRDSRQNDGPLNSHLGAWAAE